MNLLPLVANRRKLKGSLKSQKNCLQYLNSCFCDWRYLFDVNIIGTILWKKFKDLFLKVWDISLGEAFTLVMNHEYYELVFTTIL